MTAPATSHSLTVSADPAAPPRVRNRYLDTLRAIAIIRVIVFHMWGFAWLAYLFPAMGVMFAIAGSLMAGSMRRSTTRAVRSRVRRLLPAMWVMGVIVVPVMLWHGWSSQDASPLNPVELLLWLVPIAEPPGSAWAISATEVLWYLAAYLWLVLLSPLAWWAYRRMPVPTILLPLGLAAAVEFAPVELAGRAGNTVLNVVTFGACWLVGFAHRTGQLRALPGPLLGTLAVGLMTAGTAWAFTHPTEGGGLDLNDIPFAQALYSLGFVLVLIRLSPSVSWLKRVRPVDAMVTALNSRAVTVYLWHNAAIALCFPLGDRLGLWHLGGWFSEFGYFTVALVLTAGSVLALGWVEDVAARRPARLLPAVRS